jgi:hypothetical protein
MSEIDGHRGRQLWQRQAIRLAILATLIFIVFTIAAMLIYPGGTFENPGATRHIFFKNFFSDLGRTVTPDGQTNMLAAALFFLALSFAGVGLILFFVAMPGLIRGPVIGKVSSIMGSAAGLVAGFSFIGVAFAPVDLYSAAHTDFVQIAFVSFFVATLFYIPAIFLDKAYPNRYGFVFMAFAAILGGYIWLLFNGPNLATVKGLVIQVTGQKVVIYSAIISVLIQAYGAEKVLADY